MCKETSKRIISLLLCAAMLLSNVPAVVFAAGDMTEPVAETETVATEEVTVPAETELPTQPETVPEETTAPTEEPVPSTEAAEETTAPTEAAEPTEVTVTDEAAMAATVTATGKCGANLTWILDSDGVLTISGKGAMYDYTNQGNIDIDMPPWREYGIQISSLVIDDGVTSIGDAAFCYCIALETLSIPF